MMRIFGTSLAVLGLLACSGGSEDPHPDSEVPQIDAAVDAMSPDLEPLEPPDDKAAPFAVVELFTSEGCSSCPAAETVLHQLVDEARKIKSRVFPLAWHVDYWDYLGWPDPYARKEHTERQKAYAKAMGATKVFTPQMLLNGGQNLTYANLTLVGAALKAALAQPTSVSVTLWLAAGSGASGLKVNHKVKGAPAGAELVVALVERGLSNAVKAGENAGKTLKHENVVRAFAEAKAGAGQLTLTPPKDVVLSNTSLIGIVQDATTMKVIGATSVDYTKGG